MYQSPMIMEVETITPVKMEALKIPAWENTIFYRNERGYITFIRIVLRVLVQVLLR
jgi:hypothetical protein